MTRTRLILGCLLVLAAAAPAASLAYPRMPVGFQDDPSFRWREDRVTNFDNAAAAGRLDHPLDRLLVARRADAPGDRDRPVRPRLPLRGHRRARPQRGVPRDDPPAHDLGHTRLGEPQPGREPRAVEHGRPPGVLAGSRSALLGPLPRLPRTSASTRSGTSRTCRSSSRPRTARAASPPRRPSTRRWPRRSSPGSRRATGGAGRHRRDVAARAAAAARLQHDAGHDRAGPLRPARGQGAAEAQVRRLGPTPVLGPRAGPAGKGRASRTSTSGRYRRSRRSSSSGSSASS